METLNESSLSRTKAYIDNYDCCTISAFRPTNKLKNKEQSGKLGYSFYGRWNLGK